MALDKEVPKFLRGGNYRKIFTEYYQICCSGSVNICGFGATIERQQGIKAADVVEAVKMFENIGYTAKNSLGRGVLTEKGKYIGDLLMGKSKSK